MVILLKTPVYQLTARKKPNVAICNNDTSTIEETEHVVEGGDDNEEHETSNIEIEDRPNDENIQQDISSTPNRSSIITHNDPYLDDSLSSSINCDDLPSEYIPTPSTSPGSPTIRGDRKKRYGRTVRLIRTTAAMDRCGISANKAALIINEFIADMDLPQDLCVSANKLRNDAEKQRAAHIENQKGKVVIGLGIDGKEDKATLVNIKMRNNKTRTIKTSVKNVTVVETPNQEYLGHFNTESNSGLEAKNGLDTFLSNRKISYKDSLVEMNSDGTPSNTGCDNGIIALVEEDIERPVQWAICFCHHLERPWLHLFLIIDGKTLGPESFSGPIGRKMAGEIHEVPVADFAPIPCDDVSIV